MDLFKLYLDPNFNDRYPDRPSREDAIRYFVDFMSCVYNHIQERFNSTVMDWPTRKVEYLFSIPTTWKNPGLTAELKTWLQQAGFGTESQHKVEIAQTEAEAAAVYAAKQYFRVNDVVLVCDAGGGTTDINILKVTARSWTGTRLRGLTKAEGIQKSILRARNRAKCSRYMRRVSTDRPRRGRHSCRPASKNGRVQKSPGC